MSKITDKILHFFPEAIQQKIRNKYYEVKISKSTEKDEPDIIIVSKMLSSGQVAVDVGANIGLYTKHFSSRVEENGKVFSFEPIQKTFSSLKHNIQALKMNNVDAFNCALSDSAGKAEMTIPKYEEGGENFYEANISNSISGEKSESVDLKVLDEIIPKYLKVHFIKIDVEGHEINVLKGSLGTIEKSKPIFLIEINGGISQSNKNAISIIELLKTYDYQVFKRKSGGLIKVTDKDDGFNYFFLTTEHQAKFNEMIEEK